MKDDRTGERRIGMRWSCDRAWEDIRPMGRDRFCDQCNKPVYDFTQWDRSALVEHFSLHPDTCGQFRAEQLDPSLSAFPRLSSLMQHGLLASLLLTTTPMVQAQVGLPDPVEQGVHARVVAPVPVDAQPAPPLADTPHCLDPSPQRPLEGTAPSGLYFSKRPPFIHLRPSHVRGKVRVIGCPSF